MSLRPATPADDAFSLQVYATTRADEMAVVPWTDEEKQAFCEMQFHAQRSSYLQFQPEAEWLIVMRDEQPVGRMIVNRSADEIALMDIALLPEHRNAGIGSKFIKDLMDEAAATGKKMTLHVEGYNPAFRLYTRLGFKEVGEEGFYLAMEWSPESRVNAEEVREAGVTSG
ncbi:MAG TPA: GNAT family N-acetyltransferase [Pyrinomonadaceae bacterium]